MSITKERLYKEIKDTTNLPVAYHHFDTEPTIPFIIYIETERDRFKADNIIYSKERRFRVELYFEEKDYNIEEKLEQAFENINLIWEDEEDIYIEEEGLYMKNYYI